MSEERGEYYVYALIDPRDNQIFYIGKGKDARHLEHYKEYKNLVNKGYIIQINDTDDYLFGGNNSGKLNRIHQIIKSGNKLKYKFICKGLSEKAAYILEEILVERYGRKIIETGQLENLAPGGKWDEGKLILTESEKTSIDEIKRLYPELLPVLDNYPHIAREYKSIAWYVKKIPKRYALFQYSLNGELIEVHHASYFSLVTGMSLRLINKCISENKGYAYGYVWTKERKNNPQIISKDEIDKLHLFDFWRITRIVDYHILSLYITRNQEVEE